MQLPINFLQYVYTLIGLNETTHVQNINNLRARYDSRTKIFKKAGYDHERQHGSYLYNNPLITN